MASLNGVEYCKQDLLDAQAHVWNHIFSFVNSMSLKCAVQLCIPDIIHKHRKPITLSQLVDALQINKAKSDFVYRLMRMLTHSKFFINVKISDDDDNENEGYWLTPASCFLLRDEPMSMAPLVLGVLDPIIMDPWHHVSKCFRNESPSPFITKHEMSFWEYAGTEQMLNLLFNDAMARDAWFCSSLAIKEWEQVFKGLKSMVDVGGGTGTLAKAIAGALPGLKCTVLDLPHVVDGLKGAENLSYVGGNMFQYIPPADAIFLKWILHDWSDEDCLKLLEKCKESIIPSKGKGRKVIIVEMVVDDNKENHKAIETQLFFDMLMMVDYNGKERTEEEWAKLFYAAGFTSYKITTLLGLRSVIEVFP
ncbi:Hydroxyindole-O-methyltransferase [Handroanthus impetiginosus]|uniref:Hydroxyindole-O-methyltransferase n=1 Tax=Handroanthus impetiginosus TaxID=429701 RepID=A0A2G9I928_9LAMI|nr:Hydroxyindole-O-methyltransferase [Handroanthus impetiginosus]